MNILGLNFGHDGAVAVVCDGALRGYVSFERRSRVKHAGGFDRATLDLALAAAGLTIAEIDLCAVTSTQEFEFLVGLCDGLSLRYGRLPEHPGTSVLADMIAPEAMGNLATFRLRDMLANPGSIFRQMFPRWSDYVEGNLAAVGWPPVAAVPDWWSRQTLPSLVASAPEALLNDQLRLGFHYPMIATIDGRDLPAYFVDHHLSHAASVFYPSGFDDACILTHDGYPNGGWLGGMIFFGRGQQLFPVAAHDLAVGALYGAVSMRLGFGGRGGEGKMMGLAPYGTPRFFDSRFVGNLSDVAGATGQNQVAAWIAHCTAAIQAGGYDLSALADPARITDPVNADIAASTQLVFEETYLAAVDAAFRLLSTRGLETRNLCMAGGCVLNCPTNSRIARESAFREIYLEPSCGDDGIAHGAALHLYHNLLGHPVSPQTAAANQSPYMGPIYEPARIESALARRAGRITAVRAADAPAEAARDLAAGRVIAWYDGRSEIGPRALGHRSILADPRPADNWRRVNVIKGRELWRPLAPSVLREAVETWFSGCPADSPYMLYTAQVTRDGLPAITHVDGSARVQTVGPECGDYHRLISAFADLTGVPVVLNTSMNGPKEAIVETPDDAIDFLLASPVDALWIGGWRVVAASG